jgi:hypothetical protein
MEIFCLNCDRIDSCNLMTDTLNLMDVPAVIVSDATSDQCQVIYCNKALADLA